MEQGKNTRIWEKHYILARRYYLKKGNLIIPREFKTVNGYEYDENGFGLGEWLDRQRMRHSKGILDKRRAKLLEIIGMKWNVVEAKWEDHYKLAKNYYNHYGNLNIPENFKTTNGIDYDENGKRLGTWITAQRQNYINCKATPMMIKRVKLLEEIGMIWEVNTDLWMRNYELAKNYYNHYGNLRIPTNFKTVNGVDYDENGIKLGSWICGQRGAKKGIGTYSLYEEREALLNEIGMVWESNYENQWMKNYELAKIYYNHYGNLNIPRAFKTTNGYEYDEKGFCLGSWIGTQRCNKNNLSKERIELLNEIGMAWTLDSWMNMYELAKAYYNHYGNSKIPSDFKTKNGIDYDSEGSELGYWINSQRGAYKGKRPIQFDSEKVKLLDEIEMIWFSDHTNIKLQSEIITDKNLEIKSKEILNRFYSSLCSFDSSILPSKEIINDSLVKKLEIERR